jgi:hypothetical protein
MLKIKTYIMIDMEILLMTLIELIKILIISLIQIKEVIIL